MSLGYAICSTTTITQDKSFTHRRDCKRQMGTSQFKIGKEVHKNSTIGAKLLSYSQDIRFIDGIMDAYCDDMLPLPMGTGEKQSQWSPHTNIITYEFRNIDGEVVHEAPALAVTTKAMRENTPLEVGVEGQEEYSSDEGLNLSELDKVACVARRVTKEIEKENMIFHDRERPNVVHDLEGSEMGK